ncbi:hypothetical protein H4582DRAFT_630201 [Lactarius indigo]|nr:hypothetical protein H4582DRAFT_630201 [Lactarius indigo]
MCFLSLPTACVCGARIPTIPLSTEWYLPLSLARTIAHGPPCDSISGCAVQPDPIPCSVSWLTRPHAPTTLRMRVHVFEKSFYGALDASDSRRLSVPLLSPSGVRDLISSDSSHATVFRSRNSNPHTRHSTYYVVLEHSMPQLHFLTVLHVPIARKLQTWSSQLPKLL